MPNGDHQDKTFLSAPHTHDRRRGGKTLFQWRVKDKTRKTDILIESSVVSQNLASLWDRLDWTGCPN